MKGAKQNEVFFSTTIKECILFNKLSSKEITSLLALFHIEDWPKETCIINHRKLFYHFHIILSGRIKMYQVDTLNGKELTLFLLTNNDVFDLFCLLDGCEHNVYYECLDDAKVLATPMDTLRDWLNKNPKLYKNFLPYAGSQLRMLENTVSDMTFTNISTRLIKLILKNVNKSSKNLELINDLSNKELANLIGSTRAVVNRHLQKLKKNGCIKLSRNRLEIKDLNLLLHLLENQGGKNYL